MVNGKETFPLVPVAVGLYSTAFNIFNTAILFPFIGVFERVLSQVGHTSPRTSEDFSQPRYLDPGLLKDLAKGVPAIQRETARYLEAAGLFLAIARGMPTAPGRCRGALRRASTCSAATSGNYTASMFDPNMPLQQADLIASLIEEEDLTASLGETLYQVARRVERQPFSAARPGTGERDPRPDRRRHAGDHAGDAGYDAGFGRGRTAPAGAAGAARALPEAGRRPALGRTRRDPDAARQRRARVLS